MPCPVSIVEGGQNRGSCCPGTVAIRRWIEDKHPAFYYNGCYGYRKIAGSNSVSVHGSGRALDISLRDGNQPDQRDAMWYVINQLVSRYCELNLQRIIFNGRIWSANNGVQQGPAGMRTFSGSNKHNDHLHLEISPASCETLTYADVLTIMSTTTTFPNTNPAPADVQPDPIPEAIPQITQVPPPPQPSLDITDTSGLWTDETLKEVCGLDGLDDDRVITRVICGGRGGYAVDKLTGSVCAAGLATDYGDVGRRVVEFLPYGDGYYALTGEGYTIENYGPDTASTRPECFNITGPYVGLYSPIQGRIVAIGVGPGSRSGLCEFAAPVVGGSTVTGPCC